MFEFDLHATAADLLALRERYAAFLSGVTDWGARTGDREHDWTLHEALAHLATVADMLNISYNAAISGTPLVIEGFTRREDLRAWNAAQIARRATDDPAELTEDFLESLSGAAQLAMLLDEEDADATVWVPAYNRPARSVDILQWHLSHAGVVHAAQLPGALGQDPLWIDDEPALTARQVARFLTQMSYTYWPGYAEPFAINLDIGELAGYLIGDADGGDAGPGLLDGAAYHLVFDSPGALFGLMTRSLPLKDALSSGALRIPGDSRAAFDALRLFSPSPPR